MTFGNGFGTAGGVGPRGLPGSDGTDGTDGKTVLHGSGAPNYAMGADGDFYIDTAASMLYGPKVVGSWPGGVSLVGPAGTAATVAIGTVTNVGPSGPPTVTNVGTSSAATLNFGLQQGATGATGPAGTTFGGQADASTVSSTIGTETTLLAGGTITVPASGAFEISGGFNGSLGTSGNLLVILEVVGVKRLQNTLHMHTAASATTSSTAWPPYRISGQTPGASLTFRIQWSGPAGQTRSITTTSNEYAWCRWNSL